MHLWCMRFEAKHNYFKDFAHRVKCYKNIVKTMAQLYQEYLCYKLNSNPDASLFDEATMVGPGDILTIFVAIVVSYCQNSV